VNAPQPVVTRDASEGRTIGIVGDIYRFLATGEETDGRYAMIEATVLPGGGPPPHIHRREDETFYVVEGEITMQIGDERRVAKSGTFVHMPIGNLHSFTNNTDTPVKLLISFVPAGLEKMFVEVGKELRDGEMPDEVSPQEMEKILDAADRYGIEYKLPSP
jgi:quercetin dioxygenase-like cupin family protein